MKKEKLEGSYALDIVKKYATDTGKTGKPLKNYTILDCKSILRECEEYIKSLNIEDIDLRNKIIFTIDGDGLLHDDMLFF